MIPIVKRRSDTDKLSGSITKLIGYNWNKSFPVSYIITHDRADVRSKTQVDNKHCRKGNSVKSHRK